MSSVNDTPDIIFGAGGIGLTSASSRLNFTYRFHDPSTTDSLLSALQSLEITALDSAASYPPGNPWNTETLLGQTHAVEKGFIIDSKVIGVSTLGVPAETLREDEIRASLSETLRLLGTKKIRTLYSHWPQRTVPLVETARGFDRVFREGGFERLGLCSYSVAEMKEYFAICEREGLIKPSVFQGHYNAMRRADEGELMDLLRKHGCVYYAYSPLAGGFLTGKVTFAARDDPKDKSLERTRWNINGGLAEYSKGFSHDSYHDAIRNLKKVCDAASPPLTIQEASLRWLMHHSALKAGDGIIVGASRLDQLESNVADCRKGPLPKEVLDEVNDIWDKVKDH